MAKILLVEDEMLVRELAYEDLTDAGHDVTTAGTGDDAAALLQRGESFDVLFTDIRMPGDIDGWQLAARARAMLPGLKVVYATGLNDDAAQRLDGETLLTKPYRRDDLLQAIG